MAIRATAKETRIQKQQEPLATENDAPSLATNLLFREVGKKLAVMEPSKTISSTLAFDRLWKELRAGQLTAGFFIETLWIEIPSRFWQTLDSDRTKDLLRRKKGKLKLYPAELTDVIVDVVARQGRELHPSELRLLIGQSKKGFEPEISKQSWSSFLERNSLLDRPAHHQASKKASGKSQSERWRDVAGFILGYCIARPISESSKTALQHDMLAAVQRIGLDTSGWPKDSSFRDVITTGFDLGKKIKQDYPT